jgi:hypothetical protein
MSNLPDILAEFGRKTGTDGLALDDQGHCAIGVGDSIAVNLEDDGQGLVVMYAVVGMAGGDLAATYRALLEANFLGMQGRGTTLGLRPGTGAVVLSQLLSSESLDQAGFETVLEAFVTTAEDWARRLEALETGSKPAPPSGPMIGSLRA